MNGKTLSAILAILALLYLSATQTETGQDIVTAVISNWKKRAGQWLAPLNDAELRYGIPSDLLVRLAYQESHFRPDIISGATASPAGALGIMQIVPRFHPNANPLDPIAAIDYAAGYLRSLYDQFGSWTLAVAAYNAGPGNVQKAGNTVPNFPETLKYVSDIIGDVNAAGGQIA